MQRNHSPPFVQEVFFIAPFYLLFIDLSACDQPFNERSPYAWVGGIFLERLPLCPPTPGGRKQPRRPTTKLSALRRGRVVRGHRVRNREHPGSNRSGAGRRLCGPAASPSPVSRVRVTGSAPGVGDAHLLEAAAADVTAVTPRPAPCRAPGAREGHVPGCTAALTARPRSRTGASAAGPGGRCGGHLRLGGPGAAGVGARWVGGPTSPPEVASWVPAPAQAEAMSLSPRWPCPGACPHAGQGHARVPAQAGPGPLAPRRRSAEWSCRSCRCSPCTPGLSKSIRRGRGSRAR